jgi:hypothetical protein
MFKTLSTDRVSELDLLYYEIWMLNQIPTEHPVQNVGPCVLNAVLESFLIHTRNLIRFLEGDAANKENKDDLTCSRFKDRNGKAISKIPVMLPQRLTEKINKHLSHITTISTKEKLDWDCAAIRKSVNYSLNLFLRAVSPGYFPTIEGKTMKDFERLLEEPKNSGGTQ